MALVDDSSILMTIKQMLNVAPEETAFDTQIAVFINSEFMTLGQLGIGPGYFPVRDANVKWTDFSKDPELIDTLKEYIYIRVRMMFDSPASSVMAESYNSKIAELQFRLNVQAEKAWEKNQNEEEEAGEP